MDFVPSLHDMEFGFLFLAVCFVFPLSEIDARQTGIVYYIVCVRSRGVRKRI